MYFMDGPRFCRLSPQCQFTTLLHSFSKVGNAIRPRPRLSFKNLSAIWPPISTSPIRFSIFLSLSLSRVSNCGDFDPSRSPRRRLRAPQSLNRFRVTMNNNASTNSSSGSSHGRAGSCVSTTSPTPSSSSLGRTPTTCTGWTRSRSGPSSRTRSGWTTYAKNSLRSQVNFTHICVKTSSCNREL